MMWSHLFARTFLHLDMKDLEQLAAELAQMHEWLFNSIPDTHIAADIFSQIIGGYEASIPVNEIPKLQTLLAVKLRNRSS